VYFFDNQPFKTKKGESDRIETRENVLVWGFQLLAYLQRKYFTSNPDAFGFISTKLAKNRCC